MDVGRPSVASRTAADTLMKRTPRSARSRGSMRRSVTWSMQKRKPSSRSEARPSSSSDPMSRHALWRNSSSSDGARARFASRNCTICGKYCASFSVVAEMLQNSPISRFFSSRRRSTCTQRNSSRWSSSAEQAAGFRRFAGTPAAPACGRPRCAAGSAPRSSAPCAAAASRPAAGACRCGAHRSRCGSPRATPRGWRRRAGSALRAGVLRPRRVPAHRGCRLRLCACRRQSPPRAHATVSASCLTSEPSSLSSAEIGAVAARAVSAALWPWPSMVASRRPSSADLAGQVGGAARQVGDLVAEVRAVAQPRRHCIVERHARSARRPPRWSIPRRSCRMRDTAPRPRRRRSAPCK